MNLAAIRAAMPSVEPREIVGTVIAVKGLVVVVDSLPLPVGSLVRVAVTTRREHPRGEVVGFDGPRALVMLLSEADGIGSGVKVIGERPIASIPVSRQLLGRVVDALGRTPQPLWPARTGPLERGVIREPLPTGVRAIDAFLTIGKGQRIGIFAGPGVGKSTLLGSIARGTAADVNVIGLIGERGREVPEFLENVLGPEGLARSIVVVATGDETPLMRVRAALAACSIAEHFRGEGQDVLLMLDSITRFAQAQRQIGLSAGEAPATKGFTPSVFALLPRVLERAGRLAVGGSITGFYTVLVEGDDLTEPIADAAKGILDGHIVLSRKFAERSHFPAIDPLQSISRVADQVSDTAHTQARRHVIRLLSAHREAEELLAIGAYQKGANPDVDAAVLMKPHIDQFLKQDRDERADYPRTLRSLIELSIAADALRPAAAQGTATVSGPTTGGTRPRR